MSVKYQKNKGRRLKRYFTDIKIESYDINLWWYPKHRKWMKLNYDNSSYQNYVPCKSIRSFRRKLRKWKRMKLVPKGTRFILVNRFEGFNATGNV